MVNINDIVEIYSCDFRGLTIVAFYLFLLLYLVKRYIHEKNYPVAYRFFAYFGSFLFFFWPLILLCLVNKETTDSNIIVSIAFFIWSLGTICIGISLRLLPENSTIKDKSMQERKKYWKLCIGCGIYLIMLAVGNMFLEWNVEIKVTRAYCINKS